jgi:hypothetical protein
VAELIVGRRAKATGVLERMIRTAMVLELAAALVTVVLFDSTNRRDIGPQLGGRCHLSAHLCAHAHFGDISVDV